MDIKILGPGCSNCKKLEQNVRDALTELKIEANVEKITDISKFASYGIMMTPGLVINGKVYSSGKIAVIATLKSWIEKESKGT
jgi:small redox-active disulfide protein 2